MQRLHLAKQNQIGSFLLLMTGLSKKTSQLQMQRQGAWANADVQKLVQHSGLDKCGQLLLILLTLLGCNYLFALHIGHYSRSSNARLRNHEQCSISVTVISVAILQTSRNASNL